jgi:hypothetical protein
MPEEETVEWAREDEREGLSPSTQAGEFVREEMEHIRERNMGHVRRNRRSPLVCQKHDGPVSSYRRRSEQDANKTSSQA